MTGSITGKEVDAEGCNIVRVECKMANRPGTNMAVAKGEIELPRK